MRPPIGTVIAIATLMLGLTRFPAMAEAEGAGGLVALDARHVMVLRGDRLVIYEIDPARAFDVRVVKTVLLDGVGQILGQFRPVEPGVVTPSPDKPGSLSRPRVNPQPKPGEEKRLQAKARPGSVLRSSRLRVSRG